MRTMMKGAFALIGIAATISSSNAVGVSTNESELLKTTLLQNSAYQLEEANGKINVFNVIKYLENAVTGELTPKVYNVVFPNQLGNPDATGDEVKYFNWEKDAETGSYSLVEGTEDSHDLKVGLGENVYVGQKKFESGGVTNIVSGTEIESLTGDFIGNTSFSSGYSFAQFSGGAINNAGTIKKLTGNFIGNTVSYKGYYMTPSGGAINNSGTIATLTADFIGNKVSCFGIGTVRPSGGAINNSGTIGALTGDFIGNTSSSSFEFFGGAINNSGEIGTLTGDFIGNTVSARQSYGGAICNTGEIGTLTGDFIGNTSSAPAPGESLGGAIYNRSGTIGILSTADKNVSFTGNTDATGFNAIFNGAGTIRFNASANSKIVVNDKIRGFSEYRRPESILSINSAINGVNKEMSGTFNGVVEFNNEVKYQTVNVLGGTLKAGSYKGESIKISDTKTVSTEDAIAQFVSSIVTVSDGARLLIGANKTDSDLTVSFNSRSSLTLESGSILAFEENATVDISGAFSAIDATMFLELSDYIANLESDETLNLEDLDLTIATFADSAAAKDALAGFSNFKNDLGIAKGDETSDGLWFDVRQDGSSLKVVGVIPEPATFGLIGLAGAGLLAYRRRFK